MRIFGQFKQKCIVWLIRAVQRFGSHRVTVLGKVYTVSRDVFNPRYYYTSEFMARHIIAGPDDSVLDMGTGSGVQAVTAAGSAHDVTAVDINPEAVRFTQLNAAANGVSDVVTVLESDLFESLDTGKKFSLILFNPPYLEGIPRDDFEKSLYDKDKSIARKFFRDAGGYLSRGGYLQMLYSNIADVDLVLSVSEKYGWLHSLVAREKTLTEEFVIYRFDKGH